MTTSSPTIELALPHAAQRRVIDASKRFNVLACGRRWGKTTLGLDRLVEPALHGDPVGWFGPSYKSLAETWRELRSILFAATENALNSEHRIELLTGGTIELWSLDSNETANLARGRKYARVVVDEAASIRGLLEIWEQVIRPTLTDLRGGAWFLSTPRGLNDFKTLHDRGQDPEREDWASWRMPTAENPHISRAEIEAARQDLTAQAFSQEYLAEFISSEGAVFRRLDEAIITDERPFVSEPYNRYAIGCDWGKINDFSVFVVIEKSMKPYRMVEMIRSNKVDYSLQCGRLRVLRDRWNGAGITSETNSIGIPILEQLQRDGLHVRGFTTTNASKAQLIQELALAFEREEIKILNDPVLIAELQAFQAETLPSGMTRYSAPAGKHDDCVMALALALHSAKEPRVGDVAELLF